MKRVLIISYYWPPTGGSGVQRWVKFAKYLPQDGWQPVIYTPENPEMLVEDHSLGKEIPEEVEVIKKPILEPYNIYRTLTGGKTSSSQKQNKEVNPINRQKKGLLQKISMWVRGNLFIPDPRCLWIGPSVDFLKKYLKENPVDIIVSTGPPHSMHLIARKVALATDIPWIADFRDPWTKMFYFKHLSLSRWAEKRHQKLEKKVLDDASVIVAVSPLVQAEFQEMTTTPVELITNGYDENDFGDNVQAPETTGEIAEKFIITHTGLFAADGNPLKLWEALSAKCQMDPLFKEKLQIRLIGKTDKEIITAICEKGLEENLCNLGYQDHKQAVKEQQLCSMLILPLRQEPEYKAVLPGKLFEYLASRRPVLGIGQTDGAMAEILTKTCSGVTVGWGDLDGIGSYIDSCYEKFCNNSLNDNTGDISGYSRRNLSHKMALLFDDIVKKHKKS